MAGADRSIRNQRRDRAPVLAFRRAGFRRYAELGTVAQLKQDLDRMGLRSKRRMDKSGRCSGGKSFSRGALYTMLQNRLYRGEIAHRGRIHPGQHEAIVDATLWDAVQQRLAAGHKERATRRNAKEPSLLAGLIVDSHGSRMTPTHAVKAGRRYRYYVSTALIRGSRDQSPHGERLPAGDLEALVLDGLGILLASPRELSVALAPLDLVAATLKTVLGRAASVATRWPSMAAKDQWRLARSMVERVKAGGDKLMIDVDRMKVVTALLPAGGPAASPAAPATPQRCFTITVEARLRRAGKGLRLVTGDVVASKPDPVLIRLIARAIATREALLSGSDDSLEAMTRRLRVTRGRLNSLVRLSYLAPDIVRAILDGRQPVELTATRLLRAAITLPVLWGEQRQALGFTQE